MKVSEQDNYYLNLEGDAFFERNFENKDLPELRVGKQVILENIQNSIIELFIILPIALVGILNSIFTLEYLSFIPLGLLFLMI